MNNANDQKPTPEQQGVMEKLLDALDKTSDQLSMVELREELEARDINTKAFLEKTGRIIDQALQSHRLQTTDNALKSKESSDSPKAGAPPLAKE